MYIPASNAEQRPEVLFAYMETHPLATLVTHSEAGLFATHLPLVVHRDAGAHGVLEGHVARANPHHRRVTASTEALVIFAGPGAYITPTWYAATTEHGRVVPTWNYVAVHVYGTLRVVEDPAFLARHLAELSVRHEASRQSTWSVDQAPAEYIAQQKQAIVGIQIAIERVEGKWKMSQNRSNEDIDGVVRGLEASAVASDHEVARVMAERKPKHP